MIVDDDEDVHSTTTFALGNLDMQHRPLEFVHAYSAAQARECCAHETDIAVILLDVVMEQDDAGLHLVRYIRETLKLADVRIILRTGQPGYAPEIDAIRDFDINDYKTKSELTRIKLYTTVTAAIRSYEQIRAINSSRRGPRPDRPRQHRADGAARRAEFRRRRADPGRRHPRRRSRRRAVRARAGR